MADIKTAEIYSQKEGPEKRSVFLTHRDDGSIQMHTYDDGQTALKVWGKKDYEFSITVSLDAIPKLAFELLRARFAGSAGATDGLRSFCRTNDIACEWNSYP